MSKRGHRAEATAPCRAARAFGWKEPRPQTQARWSHSPSRACSSPSPCCSWPCASSPNAPGKLQCCHDHACAGSRPHDLVDTRVPSGWRVQADLAPGASGGPNKSSACNSARIHAQVTAVLSNLTCCTAQSRASQVWLSILPWPLPGPTHVL